MLWYPHGSLLYVTVIARSFECESTEHAFISLLTQAQAKGLETNYIPLQHSTFFNTALVGKQHIQTLFTFSQPQNTAPPPRAPMFKHRASGTPVWGLFSWKQKEILRTLSSMARKLGQQQESGYSGGHITPAARQTGHSRAALRLPAEQPADRAHSERAVAPLREVGAGHGSSDSPNPSRLGAAPGRRAPPQSCDSRRGPVPAGGDAARLAPPRQSGSRGPAAHPTHGRENTAHRGEAFRSHLDFIEHPAALQRLHQQVPQLRVLLRRRRHLVSPWQPPKPR